MEIKGTQSELNILTAFAGESQARNKYTYFAEQARIEGYIETAELFERMAANEREHAKVWFKLLNGGLGTTKENLKLAAQGENEEWKNMYPSFAQKAREEGLEQLAVMFERVASIENDHERIFLKAFLTLEKEKVEMANRKAKFNLDEQPVGRVKELIGGDMPYRCMFCGHLSHTMLDLCPLCEAIGAYERIVSMK